MTPNCLFPIEENQGTEEPVLNNAIEAAVFQYPQWRMAMSNGNMTSHQEVWAFFKVPEFYPLFTPF